MLGEDSVAAKIDVCEVVEREIGVVPANLRNRIAVAVIVSVAESNDILIAVTLRIAVEIG